MMKGGKLFPTLSSSRISKLSITRIFHGCIPLGIGWSHLKCLKFFCRHLRAIIFPPFDWFQKNNKHTVKCVDEKQLSIQSNLIDRIDLTHKRFA